MQTVSDSLATLDLWARRGAGTYASPSVGLSTLDPKTAVHPFGGCCKVCNAPLADAWKDCDQRDAENPDLWLFRGFLPVTCCEACMEVARKGDTSQSDAEWESRCPVEFRRPWEPAKADDRARVAATRWDARSGKGIVLHGASGSGKTRIMWQVARDVGRLGISWLWLDSLDYLDNLPPEALRVGVLFLDDLGNEPLTAQAETRLLKLIRSRCDWHRPMVVSTQHQGDSLAKRFREGASAQAVVRRLREFCEGIYVRATP